MSTTKEVKALLDELRRQLDPEQVPSLEPTLRKILDAAKPKTVTEVEYRCAPKDIAEIESLRATVASKEEAIRKLQAKLPGPPPLLDHMSFDELLKEIDNKGRAWCECTGKCMELGSSNQVFLRRRKMILDRWLRLSFATLGNYLRHWEGCNRMDEPKLRTILDENLLQTLKQIAREIHSVSGIRVDLDMPMLTATARAKVAAAQNVVVAAPGAAIADGAPRPAQAGGANGRKKPPHRRRRAR